MLFSQLITNPAVGIAFLVAIIYALTVHEFSHALAGTLLGDRTARDQGRLTLNPIRHIDLIGFLALLLVGFGWGKPVPFNPYNLRFPRWGPVIVALAGPAANVVSIIVFGFALKLVVGGNLLDVDNLAVAFFVLLIQLNTVLAAFNFLPIPPLDGSKLLYALLPRRAEELRNFLERYSIFILLAILILGGTFLSAGLRAITDAVIDVFV